MSDAVSFVGRRVGVWVVMDRVPQEDKPATGMGAFWWAMCENCKAQAALRELDLRRIVRGKSRPWRCLECKAV